MVRRSAAASRLMNSILVAVGTMAFSFCRPSRGPTSTMRTFFGNAMSAPTRLLFAIEAQQFNAFSDLVSSGEEECFDATGGRCVDGALHLHGFKDHEWCAAVDEFAGLNEQGYDAPRHGSDEAALFGVMLAADFKRVVEGEDVRLIVVEDVKAIVRCDDCGLQALQVDDGVDGAVTSQFSADRVGGLAGGYAVAPGAVLDKGSGF